ncbi:acyl-CoA dehydrogenase family protein [Tsukamurella pulmonis]|uniref:acyl-CoA dehydrogenase family protein n=1 Tax=Tsukamurella pulmonis TaxID=47312 RepID=UPI000E095900|nr:acyl-CoA dehydrogenase family protein [Tsukamurella pulmonis]RDH09410.1 acyl-CoA dehydrogenase [Tsukamurella pulmonis]
MSFTPHLLDSDVEDDLRAAVRDLLGRRVAPSDLIAAYDGDPAPGLRSELADMGVAGLLVPEESGGAGAGAAVAGVVAEELGSACAAGDFLTSAGIATATALAAGATDLVAALAAGERTAALAVPFSVDPHGPVRGVTVTGGALTGTVRSVAGALGADVLLVPGDDGALYAVEASAAQITAVSSLDMTRQLADVVLADVPGTPVAADGAAAVRAGLLTGAALLAAEQAGVARWCVTTTVAYLKERKQFGRVVGGFQALKHRLAELYADAESAAAAARSATVTLSALGTEDPETRIAVAVAAAYCSDFAVRAAEETVQLHGGIGMTWEAPVHLYLKRAKADQIGLGTAGRHRAALAGLVDLPA